MANWSTAWSCIGYEPEQRLLEAIGVIGSQIGQFMQRKRGEQLQARRGRDWLAWQTAQPLAQDRPLVHG